MFVSIFLLFFVIHTVIFRNSSSFKSNKQTLPTTISSESSFVDKKDATVSAYAYKILCQ